MDSGIHAYFSFGFTPSLCARYDVFILYIHFTFFFLFISTFSAHTNTHVSSVDGKPGQQWTKDVVSGKEKLHKRKNQFFYCVCLACLVSNCCWIVFFSLIFFYFFSSSILFFGVAGWFSVKHFYVYFALFSSSLFAWFVCKHGFVFKFE